MDFYATQCTSERSIDQGTFLRAIANAECASSSFPLPLEHLNKYLKVHLRIGTVPQPPEPGPPEPGMVVNDCAAAQSAGYTEDGMYEMADGTRRWCDLNTDGGGWTLIARVNEDYAWVCPSHGGGDCNGAGEPRENANLFSNTHWGSSVTLEPQEGANSGLSTNPDIIRERYLGDGGFDLRFSFYETSESMSPRDDAYATFPSVGDM
eukprot:SAG31_NODE_2048_length_6565_cov_2.692700_5_plen_207_part_00